MIAFKVTSSGIKLYDSCKVGKRDMEAELLYVRSLTFGSEVWKRSMRSLCAEWRVHSALYALGIARSKTKDVDLNYPLPWYASAAYWVFGAICWIFIK